MSQPPAGTTATTTFIVRFWREWTGGKARWRGRIEHVQSGRRVDFLGVGELLRFLERFGIGAEADAPSRRTTGGAGADVIDDLGPHTADEP